MDAGLQNPDPTRLYQNPARLTFDQPSPEGWKGSEEWGYVVYANCIDTAPGSGCEDDYGARFTFTRDKRGRLRPALDQLTCSLHTFTVLKDPAAPVLASQSRIYAVYQSRKEEEATDNVYRALAANADPMPNRLSRFADPGLRSARDDLFCNADGTAANNHVGCNYGVDSEPLVDVVHPLESARHDFWARLHRSHGVWLYSWRYRNFTFGGPRQAWVAYSEGLSLIRAPGPTGVSLREALANGDRVSSIVPYDAERDWFQGPATTAPQPPLERDYGPSYGIIPTTDAVPIQWTACRLAQTTWLVVTSSNSAGGDFEVTLPTGTTLVGGDPMAGPSSAALSLSVETSGLLTLEFAGIDAAVILLEG